MCASCTALNAKRAGVVSSDAVYRQTFYKERLWRERGAACVEMETSAVFSVSAYLGIKAAAALVVSECTRRIRARPATGSPPPMRGRVHPTDEGAPDWHWHMDGDMRKAALERVVSAVVDEVV